MATQRPDKPLTKKRRVELAKKSGVDFLKLVKADALQATVQQDTTATTPPPIPCQTSDRENNATNNNSAPIIEDDPENYMEAAPEASTSRENISAEGATAEEILNGVTNLNLDDVFNNLSLGSESEDETLHFHSNYRDFNLELHELIINDNISHNTTSKLLKLLNKHKLIAGEEQEEIKLPNDARTFLGTPREKIKVKSFPITDASNKKGAEYIYFGLEKPLLERLKHAKKLPNKIKLKFNIDGLPLGKCGKLQFWPILCMCSNIEDSVPSVVGLYCGYEKPCDPDLFLKNFVIELKEILKQKYRVNVVTCEFKVECFICDAPARAMILGIIQYNGTKGCGKCTVEGKGKPVVFLESDCPLRTNASFRSKDDKLHHKRRSILEECGDWKATELRTFLLYLGPVCLKSVLPPNYYNHFMSLSIAIRILVSPELIKDHVKMQYADTLLRHFVNTYASYYGEENMVYNVHNCIHLVNDCRELGTLDSFSSFPFENYLGYIKRHYLRNGVKPLQQVCKRLIEIENLNKKIGCSRKQK